MPSKIDKAYDKFQDLSYPYLTKNPGSLAALTRDISTLPLRTVAGVGSALGQYASNPSTLQGVGDAFSEGMIDPEKVAHSGGGAAQFGASMATDPLSLPLTMFGLPEAKAVSRLPALARVLVNAGQLGSINALDNATKQMSVKSDIRDFDVGQSTKAGLMGASLGLGLGSLGVAIPALVNRLTTVSGKVGAFPVVQDKISDLVAGHPSYGGPINQSTRDLIPYASDVSSVQTPKGSITDFFIKPNPINEIPQAAPKDTRFLSKLDQEDLLASLKGEPTKAPQDMTPFLGKESHAIHLDQLAPAANAIPQEITPFLSKETHSIYSGLLDQ